MRGFLFSALAACLLAGALPSCAGGACDVDDDCAAGYVCEGAAPGCTERACVAGCREGTRPCTNGRTCSTVVCVTCPCPGVCE